MSHYSTISVILFAGAIGMFCYYLGTVRFTPTFLESPQKIQTIGVSSTTPESLRNNYQNIVAAESCSYFQCLFKKDGQIVGYGTLNGYYRSETVTGGGEENAYAGRTQVCNQFVVTGGSQPLINQFLDMIKSSNTLNKMTGSNLVINLDLGDPNLSPALVDHIRTSTAQIPISIGVL